MTEDQAKEFSPKLDKEIETFCDRLRELGVDAVQVMATWEQCNTIGRRFWGSGNIYARHGMAHEFINEAKSQVVAYEIADAIHPDKK